MVRQVCPQPATELTHETQTGQPVWPAPSPTQCALNQPKQHTTKRPTCGPRRRMAGTEAIVSTLLMVVGQPYLRFVC